MISLSWSAHTYNSSQYRVSRVGFTNHRPTSHCLSTLRLKDTLDDVEKKVGIWRALTSFLSLLTPRGAQSQRGWHQTQPVYQLLLTAINTVSQYN